MTHTPIPVHALHMPARTERLQSLESQFAGRSEFRLHVVRPVAHRSPVVSLWRSFVKIVEEEAAASSPFFIFCEDDHVFTRHYSAARLRRAIRQADALGADLLSGGMSWIRTPLQLERHLFWVERFNGMQFTVVFRRFYPVILAHADARGQAADIYLSGLSDNLLVMHPYISRQQEFGYSDVTPMNNRRGHVTDIFDKTCRTLDMLSKVGAHYRFPSHR